MTSYHPSTRSSKIVDYTLIVLLSMAIGGAGGWAGAKFFNHVLTHDLM